MLIGAHLDENIQAEPKRLRIKERDLAFDDTCLAE